MAAKEFNLLHEPWVRVLRFDGSVDELSLLDVFAKAENYRGLGGELPTQDLAVLRLLLAILHTVVERVDVAGNLRPIKSPAEALERWQGYWKLGRIPSDVIERYLLGYEDRFWLFHDKFPFYQIPGLEARGTAYTASKLNGVLSQSGNKVRIFAGRTGLEQEALCYSEAARWLVHLQAFDDSAGKPESRGQGLPSPGFGWLGKIGPVWAEGESLFETLLLNLVLFPEGNPKPVWERKKVKTDERTEIPAPNNLAELYTIQSRRVMLQRSGNEVIGYRLIGGDFFAPEAAAIEPMTLWYKVEAKRGKGEYWTPRRHDASEQMWRNLAVFVGQADNSRAPGIVRWLANLKGEECLEKTHFNFRIVGVEYSAKGSSIDHIFEDYLRLNCTLIAHLGEDWMLRIIAEIALTRQLVWQLGILAGELAKAAGEFPRKENSTAVREAAAREQAYAKLDEPFRRWLEAIDPIKDVDKKREKCEEWWQIARNIVRQEARAFVEKGGSQAFIGRERTEEIEGKHAKRRYIGPKIYSNFLYRTSSRKILLRKERR